MGGEGGGNGEGEMGVSGRRGRRGSVEERSSLVTELKLPPIQSPSQVCIDVVDLTGWQVAEPMSLNLSFSNQHHYPWLCRVGGKCWHSR